MPRQAERFHARQRAACNVGGSYVEITAADLDTLLAGGYDGPVHFDFKTPRTEDDNGVWVAAEACMRNYLILREKAQAFRADPEVQSALADAQLPELAKPTMSEGETWSDIEAGEVPDVEAIGAHGMAFERLDQLALEHLYGVRS